MTPVTFVPIVELMVTTPLPEPTLVTVPALFIFVPENVIVPLPVSSSLIVKLFDPVILPLKMTDIPLPVLPTVKVDVLPLCKVMALAMVRPLVPTSRLTAALPLV